MKLRTSFLSIIAIFFISFAVHAQRQSVLVSPQATDPNISTNLNNHYVSINRSISAKSQLFVMFPGTGGVAFNYLEVNNTAADLGFHSVNLTYPNDDAVNTLCGFPNTDLDCYGKIRLETKDGTDRTPLVPVNRANSIENRLLKLLIYLRNQSPADNWGQFLINDSTLNWSKIIVGGHSQGGGHAGIIGRYEPVVRVLMFAAMDFNGLTNSPANWIGVPSSTPNASTPDKFWGFCHLRDDSVNFTLLSTRIWPAYGMPGFGAIFNVDNTAPPFGNSHSLMTDMECDNTHGCIVADARLVRVNGIPVLKPVWEYMLSNTVSPLSISGVRFSRFGLEVARPPLGVSSKSYEILIDGSGFDSNSVAVINGAEISTAYISPQVLRAKLQAGRVRPSGRSTLQIRGTGGALSTIFVF